MLYAVLAGCLVLGYLVGSVNTSLVVGKFYGVDIRKHGSGNAGATNALRTLGKKAALIVLAGDLLKSLVAVVLALIFAKFFIGGDKINLEYCKYISGLGAVLGHNFPVYFGFRGGKGVLTSIGFILILDWRIGLMILAVCVLIMVVTKYISLGSVCGAILFPVFVFAFHLNSQEPTTPAYIALSIAIGGLAIYQHRSNLSRLMNGTESKFGEKSSIQKDNNEN